MGASASIPSSRRHNADFHNIGFFPGPSSATTSTTRDDSGGELSDFQFPSKRVLGSQEQETLPQQEENGISSLGNHQHSNSSIVEKNQGRKSLDKDETDGSISAVQLPAQSLRGGGSSASLKVVDTITDSNSNSHHFDAIIDDSEFTSTSVSVGEETFTQAASSHHRRRSSILSSLPSPSTSMMQLSAAATSGARKIRNFLKSSRSDGASSIHDSDSYFLSQPLYEQLNNLLLRSAIYSRNCFVLSPTDEHYMRRVYELERECLVDILNGTESSSGDPIASLFPSQKEQKNVCETFFRKRYREWAGKKLELAHLLKVKFAYYDSSHVWDGIELFRFDQSHLDQTELVEEQISKAENDDTVGHWDLSRLEFRETQQPAAAKQTGSGRRRSSVLQSLGAGKLTSRRRASSTRSRGTFNSGKHVPSSQEMPIRTLQSAIRSPSKRSSTKTPRRKRKLTSEEKGPSSSRAASHRRPTSLPQSARTSRRSSVKATQRRSGTADTSKRRSSTSSMNGQNPTNSFTKKPRRLSSCVAEAAQRRRNSLTRDSVSAPLPPHPPRAPRSSIELKPKRRLSKRESSHISFYMEDNKRRKSLGASVVKKVDHATFHARKRLSDAVHYDPLKEKVKTIHSSAGNSLRRISASFNSNRSTPQDEATSDFSSLVAEESERVYASLNLNPNDSRIRRESLPALFKEASYYKTIVLLPIRMTSSLVLSSVHKLNKLYERFSPRLCFMMIFTFDEHPDPNTLHCIDYKSCNTIEQRCESVHEFVFRHKLRADMIFVDGMKNQFRDSELVEYPFGVYVVHNSKIVHVNDTLLKGFVGESVNMDDLQEEWSKVDRWNANS